MEDKRNNFLKCILPSIVILGLQLFITWAAVFFLFVKKAHTYTNGGYRAFLKEISETVMSSAFNSAAMLVYAIVAAVLFYFWYRHAFVEKEKTVFHFSNLTTKPLHFGVGIVLLTVGMQYLCVYLMQALAMVFPQWLLTYESMLEGVGLTEEITVPLLLYTVFFGPICEELAFRGLTFKYAKRFCGFWTANIIQAVLFAGMHMNPMQGIYTFFMGLLFGFLVHKSNSVWMGVILHIAFNGVGVLANQLLVMGTKPWEVFAIMFFSMVATYFGFSLVEKNVPQKG